MKDLPLLVSEIKMKTEKLVEKQGQLTNENENLSAEVTELKKMLEDKNQQTFGIERQVEIVEDCEKCWGRKYQRSEVEDKRNGTGD